MTKNLKVLILCGVVGSGKTYFSTALCANLPDWKRISQDDLGSRQACELTAQRALREGLNVVIDRCNFDRSQRKTWIKIAEKERADVYALELRTPVEKCRQRIMQRDAHPTGVIGTFGSGILDKFIQSYKPPQAVEEGLKRVYAITMSTDVEWTPSVLHTVLQRLTIV